jgi:hypothetical protein
VPEPKGFGVNAVPAIWSGSVGSAARKGSLSWLVSPLSASGIMLTTRLTAPGPGGMIGGWVGGVVGGHPATVTATTNKAPIKTKRITHPYPTFPR